MAATSLFANGVAAFHAGDVIAAGAHALGCVGVAAALRRQGFRPSEQHDAERRDGPAKKLAALYPPTAAQATRSPAPPIGWVI